MRDVLAELERRWAAGETVGLATVVDTWRSAPRQPGAAMLVGADDTVTGSVSGGCVEGAVYELGRRSRASGEPVLQRYGVSDDDAFAVGLTCGGIVEVFVEPVSRETFPELGAVAADIREGRPVALATVVGTGGSIGTGSGTGGAGSAARGGGAGTTGARLVVRPDSVSGSLGHPRLDQVVRDDVRGLLAQGSTRIVHYGPEGQRRGAGVAVFVASYAPRPRMIVFGATDFAAAVARVGGFLGYRVTVCDARPTFATSRRFPDADEVVVDWPHRYLASTEVDGRTVVCVLTHDPKFDVPVLEVALRLPLAYVGSMGSRRTVDDRLARLRERGLTEAELSRLRAPIGLDIGGSTPEETAVSIAAEIIAVRGGGTGGALRTVEGPIHHQHTPADR